MGTAVSDRGIIHRDPSRRAFIRLLSSNAVKDLEESRSLEDDAMEGRTRDGYENDTFRRKSNLTSIFEGGGNSEPLVKLLTEGVYVCGEHVKLPQSPYGDSPLDEGAQKKVLLRSGRIISSHTAKKASPPTERRNL